MALPPGTRLGPYEVTAQLGVGGMGEVYRATDTNLKRQVAIKVLPEAVAADAERLARFQREAEVLAALNHPNIAGIYGLERADGRTALVMELVEGPTLADRIVQGAISVDEALPIAKQIAEALEAAHEQGIIHRDLKPANIKLRPDGTVKVLDFGLAKAMDPVGATSASQSLSPTITTPAMTQAGMILGTAAYMSPEQARGKTVDRRADIWAFGTVLYEMLTGRRAFEDEDISLTLSRVLRMEPAFDALPADVPATVTQALRVCLQKDLRQRASDIHDVRLALEGAFGPGGPVTAPPVASRTSTLLVSIGAAAVAAIVAGVGVWTVVRPVAQPQVARSRFLLPDAQQYTSDFSNIIDVSSDGTQVVYGAENGLFVRPIAELDSTLIPGTASGSEFLVGTSTPVFSPDGGSIAYYDGVFRKIATRGGTSSTLWQGDRPWGMSWSGDWIVLGLGPAGVVRLPANGGAPQQLITVGEGEVAAHPRMLPGDAVVLFTLASSNVSGPERWNTAQIVAEAIDTHERTIIIDGGSDARYVATGHLVYALGNTLFAVPFDARRLEVTGGAVPVVEGVRRSSTLALGVGAAFYAVSDSGSLVYVPGGDPAALDRQVLRIGRDGDVEPLSLASNAYRSLRVSPDGRRLVFDTDEGREGHVWVYDLSGALAPQKLTFDGRNQFPIWSADGERVVFQSDRDGNEALYWQRPDGNSPAERLMAPGEGVSHIPESWSPTEETLAYSETRDGVVTLWTFSMADQQETRVGTVQSIAPFNAQFSPDGRWLAYTVRSGSAANVFVEPFPATGAKYQITTENGHHPVWLPDGTGLSYRVGDSEQVTVSVDTTRGFSFGNPVTERAGLPTVESFSARSYDITPDGASFVAVAVEAGAEGQLGGLGSFPQEFRIVLNWVEELKRLVPTNRLAMALSPGTRLGPYEVTAQLGVGGMGEVYHATDTNLKRQVAIKVLPEAVAADAVLAGRPGSHKGYCVNKRC